MGYLLGIDLGTSGLKAAIFAQGGKLLGRGAYTNEYLPGPPGCAEQDPRMWWKGCCEVVQAALVTSEVDAADIASVGVCGFHHCPVFLGEGGDPVRSSIVTHDVRLRESLGQLTRSGLLHDVSKLSGSRVLTGHFPPIFHYVQQNDPESLDNTRWIILAKDYLRYRLTGKVGTEICDATGTNLVAMPDQGWSDTLCDLVGVSREKLPHIGRSDQVCGEVTSDAAQATGLRAGTPVVHGGGDSHCALVGLGVVGAGEVGLLLGTNSTLRASFRGFAKHLEHVVWAQQHVVPGMYTVSASSMAGSSVLSWFRDRFFGECPSLGSAEIFREFESLASSVQPGCDGLLFHPYLFGERSPFDNPRARGAFLAVTHWHRKAHFVRSIMEGVAFCIANCFDVIAGIAHSRGETIAAVRTGESGGSRLNVWRQIIADSLVLPVEVVGVAEPGCLGAAILAGVGAGLYRNVESAARRTALVVSQNSPDPRASERYRRTRETFNSTFRLLEPILYERPQGGEVE